MGEVSPLLSDGILPRVPSPGSPHSSDGGSFYTRFRGQGYVPPPRRQSWYHAGFILVAELVGTGVLGLPETFAVIGMWNGIALLVTFALFSLYSGLLLHRLQDWFKQGITYGDMAFEVYGRVGQHVVFGFIYIAFFGNLAIYILTCAETLQNTFYDSKWSKTALTLVTAAVLLPFCQLRTLHHVSFVAAASAVAIFASLCIVLGVTFEDWYSGRVAHLEPLEGESSTSSGNWFLRAMPSMTTAIFAFGGQGLYFETMAEMKDPDEFPKAVTLTTWLILAIYLIVAITCYGVYGDAVKENILFALPNRLPKRIASGLLFFHVCISYVLAQQVIGRAILVRVVDHEIVDSGTNAEKRRWLGISSGLLLCSLLIANGIPFFKNLMGFVAALSTAPLTFGIPAAMVYHGSKHLSPLQDSKERIHRWEYPALAFFVVLSLFIMIAGVSTHIYDIFVRR